MRSQASHTSSEALSSILTALACLKGFLLFFAQDGFPSPFWGEKTNQAHFVAYAKPSFAYF